MLRLKSLSGISSFSQGSLCTKWSPSALTHAASCSTRSVLSSHRAVRDRPDLSPVRLTQCHQFSLLTILV